MSQQTCKRGCDVPTDRQLCRPCVGRIQHHLVQVPALINELETLLVRQAAMVERVEGAASAETPLPFHLHASTHLHLLRHRLVAQVKDLASDDDSQYPKDTLAAMSRWLLARIDFIANHPAADELHDEIVDTCQDAWAAVDLAANRTRFDVGSCPEVDCPGEVWAYIPTSAERPARLECRECGRRWESHQWLRVGKRMLARRASWTARSQRSRSA